MKKTIILHGYLADLHPHDIEVEATTVAEAVRALQQIPALAENGPHPVQIDDVETEVALFSETSMSEIHIRPRMGGGGGNKGSWAQIALGVVMVAVAVANPALAIGGFGIAQGLFTTGIMMTLGGVTQLLAPTEREEEQRQKRSFAITGDRNTVALGTPVPLAYGFNKLGGHFLSFDVDAVASSGESDVDKNPSTAEIKVVEHDKTSVGWAVLLPRFTSATPGPGNIPTSNWVDA